MPFLWTEKGEIKVATKGLCYYCKSPNISIERRMNGYITCKNCNAKYKNFKIENGVIKTPIYIEPESTMKKEFSGCLYCGSRNIDSNSGDWECRDCGCSGGKDI